MMATREVTDGDEGHRRNLGQRHTGSYGSKAGADRTLDKAKGGEVDLQIVAAANQSGERRAETAIREASSVKTHNSPRTQGRSARLP